MSINSASAGPNLSVPPPFDHSSENPIIYMTEGEELGGARSRSGQLGNPIKKTKGRGGSALDSSRAKGGGGGGSAGFAAEPRAWKEREGGPVAQRHRRAELATMEVTHSLRGQFVVFSQTIEDICLLRIWHNNCLSLCHSLSTVVSVNRSRKTDVNMLFGFFLAILSLQLWHVSNPVNTPTNNQSVDRFIQVSCCSKGLVANNQYDGSMLLLLDYNLSVLTELCADPGTRVVKLQPTRLSNDPLKFGRQSETRSRRAG